MFDADQFPHYTAGHVQTSTDCLVRAQEQVQPNDVLVDQGRHAVSISEMLMRPVYWPFSGQVRQVVASAASWSLGESHLTSGPKLIESCYITDRAEHMNLTPFDART